MREQWDEKVKQEAIKQAVEEAKREMGEEVELEKEEKEEAAYQEMLLTQKTKVGIITQEQYEQIKAEQKKRR